MTPKANLNGSPNLTPGTPHSTLQFLSEDVFVSKSLALALLGCTVLGMLAFVYKWRNGTRKAREAVAKFRAENADLSDPNVDPRIFVMSADYSEWPYHHCRRCCRPQLNYHPNHYHRRLGHHSLTTNATTATTTAAAAAATAATATSCGDPLHVQFYRDCFRALPSLPVLLVVLSPVALLR